MISDNQNILSKECITLEFDLIQLILIIYLIFNAGTSYKYPYHYVVFLLAILNNHYNLLFWKCL